MPLPLALTLLWFQDDSAVPPVSSGTTALMEMIHNSGPVAFAVLVLLALASILSWGIMLAK